MLHFAVFSSVATLPAVFWLQHMPSLWTCELLVLVGASAAVGQLCITRAYTHGEAAIVSGLDYATVLSSAIMGALVFGEWLGPGDVLGGALIVIGGLALALG